MVQDLWCEPPKLDLEQHLTLLLLGIFAECAVEADKP